MIKKIIILLFLIVLLILNGCANKVTGSSVKKDNPNKAGVLISGSFVVDKNLCFIVNDAYSSSILNKHCKVDSDCYSAAKALGISDMNNVKCNA